MEITSQQRSEGEPHDELTALCGKLLDQIPEGIKGIVILDRGNVAGMGAHDYEDDDAIVRAFRRHLQAFQMSRLTD